MSWLATPSRPIEANTDERPSSTGMPAARSAPKASIRMISVIGMESFSAFWKSEASLSSMAFSNVMLAELVDGDARGATARPRRRWRSWPAACRCRRRCRRSAPSSRARSGRPARAAARIDGRDVAGGVEPLRQIGGDGLGRSASAQRAVRGLDEHHLAGGLLEAGVVQASWRRGRTRRRRSRPVERLRADERCRRRTR